MSNPPCPVCGKPSVDPAGPDARSAPFCSVRCADVDLGRWFTGRYRVPLPAEEVDPPDTLE